MSAVLHIKDSYYFEIPKFLLRSHRVSRDDFPDYWIRLDPDFQDWEAGELYDALSKSSLTHNVEMPERESLLADYRAWRAHGRNLAKPFSRFLEEGSNQEWFQEPLGMAKTKAETKRSEEDQAAKAEAAARAREAWDELKANTASLEEYESQASEWSAEKTEKYNRQLDGKILIPQPFGTLKNNYEAASGFCISKYMIIELLVAVILCFVFIRLANRMQRSDRPRGKLWNMFETILLYFRDNVVRPAIGEHDAARFTPLLWTVFLFVLGCNLFGMLPYMGAPTAAFGVTLGLAIVTFAVGLIFGTKKFGVLGYWKNQVPSMGLPLYLAVVIVPMIFVIEVVGLLIKHTVLGVRLLANMVAGHLVLLAIMGMAVAAAGSASWGVTATIAVIGSTLFSCLELFVAFLQAYVFTFLSALFIGAAIHHH